MSQNEVAVKEIDVRRLNMQPGEILVVTLKIDNVTRAAMQLLQDNLESILPNNQVVVLSVKSHEDIDLTVVNDSININTTETGE